MRAAMRVDQLSEAGDLAGSRIWLAIVARIGELSGIRDGETQH